MEKQRVWAVQCKSVEIKPRVYTNVTCLTKKEEEERNTSQNTHINILKQKRNSSFFIIN